MGTGAEPCQDATIQAYSYGADQEISISMLGYLSHQNNVLRTMLEDGWMSVIHSSMTKMSGKNATIICESSHNCNVS